MQPKIMTGYAPRAVTPQSGLEDPVPPYDNNEKLPKYSPVVTKVAVLDWKPEFVSPVRRALRRRWSQVRVEVNSTQLKIVRQGKISSKTKCFSLQYADIGLAFDYVKRPWVLRLRCEGRQFLFDMKSHGACHDWIVAISQGISLALPLELRTLPEDIHRTRRRNRRILQRSGYMYRREHFSDANGEKSVLTSATAVAMAAASQDLWVDQKRAIPRRSRVSNRDYPHLGLDASWERKVILYNGHWAVVRERTITPLRV